MVGRPKTRTWNESTYSFSKIYPDDKARAQAMADKLEMTLSAYVNKAVFRREVARDEKSENQTETNKRTRTVNVVVQ